MTSSGKLLIVSTPFGGEDDPSARTVAALADADDVLCVSEDEGRTLLQTAGLDIPVSMLDPELPTADIASIVAAIDDGHTIAAICRSDNSQDIDTMARLVRACELQGVDVDLITSPTHALLTVLHRGSAPPGTPPSLDDMYDNEQEGQGGRDGQGRPPRRGGRRRPGGAPRQRDEQRPQQPRQRDDRPPREQRQRDDRPPRDQRQRDDRPPRDQRQRDDRPPRDQRQRDDRPQRPQGRRDDRPQRPQGRRDDRPQRPHGRRDDRRDRPPVQRDRDRDRGPRQRPSYDEVQPMSNETMFGYAPRKRPPEQPRSSGNPQYIDGPPRRREHEDDDRRPPRRGGRGPQRPQQRRDRPQGGQGQGQGPQRGRKQTGGKGRPVKGRGGKPKTIGMVTKKRAERQPKGPKVYTSQMFLYKENLDERKPTERTLRTRRKKSSDDS